VAIIEVIESGQRVITQSLSPLSDRKHCREFGPEPATVATHILGTILPDLRQRIKCELLGDDQDADDEVRQIVGDGLEPRKLAQWNPVAVPQTPIDFNNTPDEIDLKAWISRLQSQVNTLQSTVDQLRAQQLVCNVNMEMLLNRSSAFIK